MTRMVRRGIGLFLAVVLIGAHLPLPGGRRAAGAGHAPICCTPKACCVSSGGCDHGGGCAAPGAAHTGGFQLFAGGCRDQAPRVTPVSLDPTLPAPGGWGARLTSASSEAALFLETYRSLDIQPPVPPPRA